MVQTNTVVSPGSDAAVVRIRDSKKALAMTTISTLIFTQLKTRGIPSHFIERLSEVEQLVQKVEIVPLEVVVRNIVAGSLSKRLGVKEGKLPSKVAIA